MAYIGTSPTQGVRRIYNYTATASQTSFSGNDTLGISLAYADGAYIDVYQNGVLLIPTDYVATTGTTVVLDTGAAVNDTVQMVVYDVFSVGDSVSQSAGGNFAGDVGMGGTLAVTGVPTFTGRSVHSGGITIANAGQIGSVGDADSMAISSGGVVTFSQAPVGAGIDLLLDATISSAVSVYDVTAISSTYDAYKLVFDLLPVSDNVTFNIQALVGGSVVTDANHGFQNQTSDGGGVITDVSDVNFAQPARYGVGNAAGEGCKGYAMIQSVNSTSSGYSILGAVNEGVYNGNHFVATFFGGAALPAARANVLSGIRFKFSSGNIASGTVQLYGLRK